MGKRSALFLRIKTLSFSYKTRTKCIYQVENPSEITGKGLGLLGFLDEFETELHLCITAVYYVGKTSSVLNYTTENMCLV